MNVSNTLIIWHKDNARELPWKSDKDPYKIWISEIILQQTRVAQAKSYYLSFISHFPTLESLANAPLDQLIRLWQGLGYYSRARNMHMAAGQIMTEYHGQFPRTTKELSRLKGVGPYTAAAIAAFAFDAPVVALDGNAFRIFARLFAEPSPIDSLSARTLFSNIAQQCMSNTPSSLFNQAIMDFGSLVCTPRPKCHDCPLSDQCLAFLQNRVSEFPVKGVKKAPKARYFYYLHITLQEHDPTLQEHNPTLQEYTFIQQRLQRDIWQKLYQFPLIETRTPISPDDLPNLLEWGAIFRGIEPHIAGYAPKYIHRLTHQVLHTFFIYVRIEKESEWLQSHCKKIHVSSLDNYGIPRLMERYLQDGTIKYLPLAHANLLE